jgi:hypothetical protein
MRGWRARILAASTTAEASTGKIKDAAALLLVRHAGTFPDLGRTPPGP